MAEVIGVVAATLEFTKVFLELKEITSSIRHAPEEMRELIEELNLTADILQTLAEQDAMLSVYAPPAVTQKCRVSCMKAVEVLKPVCIQLSKSIERSRWRGSIRIVLKDAFLEKARIRIERAKSNLSLAQMATFSAMNALSLQQHASTQALVLTALSVAPPLHSGGDCGDGQSQSFTPKAAQMICTDNTDPSGQRPNVNTDLNLWLGKRFDVIRERALGVSTFTIRTYNIVPWNSLVFRVVSDGDVAELQALFQKKEATIFDRDEYGNTLLHV
ncbi:hypothetical protein LTR10_021022 [Elasticomyces elasticus]|uniref:Fungal N-terminal domain-containing protein n=1 Tax=Exophiala sideris TaxID=1016849 RepID=A0ABR0JNA2_9EURO|nr:hypothetical protein LTR10_021022 [Elasticomyces elasticus]KAK5036531.1 hypothetical protein LTS07_002258 [Exophiala sideris]KAK5066914.1 hypothetical protein LTR69_002262 [Exophiala sideris]KAK5184973.1 hypothetical protein LTR44_002819 [Eurotiomycetes sp. CCFEE 6388]